MVFKKESFGLDGPTSKIWDVSELAYDSDGSNEEPDPLHPEDWQDWYSESLLDAWAKIREYSESNYIKIDTTYPKFVEFVMDPHQYWEPVSPTITEHNLWNLVSTVPIISSQVTDMNFFTWVRKNINHHCNV